MTDKNTNVIEEGKLYEATFTLRSVGTDPATFVTQAFSSELPDEYEGPLPASYHFARDLSVMMSMMQTSMMNTDFDLNELGDPDTALKAIEQANSRLEKQVPVDGSDTKH